MKESIEQQICARWEYDEACKPKNQKLFPFYLFTNFSASRQYPVCYEPLKCTYCGESLSDTKGGYYTAFIVFESASDIRICCNLHCKGGHLYEYKEQIHGYTKALAMPEKYKNSLSHLVVARCFLSAPGKWYQLNKYLHIGFNTWQEFIKFSNAKDWCGGSHIYPDNGEPIRCWWRWDCRHLTTQVGEKIKLTKTEIVNVVNEILEANRTIQVQQLSLF